MSFYRWRRAIGVSGVMALLVAMAGIVAFVGPVADATEPEPQDDCSVIVAYSCDEFDGAEWAEVEPTLSRMDPERGNRGDRGGSGSESSDVDCSGLDKIDCAYVLDCVASDFAPEDCWYCAAIGNVALTTQAESVIVAYLDPPDCSELPPAP